MGARPAGPELILAILFALALSGVAAGIRLAKVPAFALRVVPFSGGVLMGIAAFWVMPEIAEQYGWTAGIAGAGSGFLLLWTVHRCEIHMKGLAAPLLAASGVHCFFDGWSVAVARNEGSGGLQAAFLAGIALHKVPEGLALGALLLAALGSPWKAALSACAVQGCMFVGALSAVLLVRRLPTEYGSFLLAIAAGIFIYLGFHAVEEQWRIRGARSALAPALTGAAGVAALRLVPGF